MRAGTPPPSNLSFSNNENDPRCYTLHRRFFVSQQETVRMLWKNFSAKKPHDSFPLFSVKEPCGLFLQLLHKSLHHFIVKSPKKKLDNRPILR